MMPATRSHLDALVAHWSIPEVGRWLFDGETPAREKVEEELGQSSEMFSRLGLGVWCLFLDSDSLIGTCGFLEVAEVDEIEILFSLEPEFWRQGLAYEASIAALDEVFLTAGLDRVIGRCDVPNEASKGLLKKLGMELEKREPIRGLDSYHFGLACEDWLLDRPS